MTVLEVVYTEILFGAVIIVCEVPAGWLADRFGRKRLIVTGLIFEAVMFGILLSADTFWAFATAIMFSALGAALLSGAEHALLYESLQHMEQQEKFDWHLGRLRLVQAMGLMIAAFSGSWLAGAFSFVLTYWISLGSMTVAVILSLFLVDSPRESRGEIKGFVTTLVEALTIFKSEALVLYVFGLGSSIALAASFVEEFWQLYLIDSGAEVSAFGWFYLAVLLAQVPGNLMVYSLRKRFERKQILQFVTIASFLVLILAALFVNGWGIFMLLLLLLFASTAEPLVLGALHEHADDSMRATIESMFSLVFHVGVLGVGLLFGWISTQFSLATAFGLLGVVCVLTLIVMTKRMPP